MATARERAKMASEEALRQKMASPGGASRTAAPGRPPLTSSHSSASRSSTLAPKASGSTLSKPPTRPPPSSSTTRPRPPRSDSDVSSRAGDAPSASAVTPRASTLTASTNGARPVRPATSTSSASTAPRRPVTATKATTTTPSKPSSTAPAVKKTPTPLAQSAKLNTPTAKTPRSPRKLTADGAPPRSPAKLLSPSPSRKKVPLSPTLSSTTRSPPAKLALASVHELPPSALGLRPRAPSQIASDAEVEVPRKIGHGRARSVVIGRPRLPASRLDEEDEDQGPRELRIMNDLFKETRRREELEDEIGSLKQELGQKDEEIKQLKKGGDAGTTKGKEERARESSSDPTEQMRKRYERQLKVLRDEIEGLKSKSHKLAGVEGKIVDVEAALKEKSEKERTLTDDLSKESRDNLELAKTIQDLREEIDRAQKTLDEESRRERKEKEAAVKVTEGLKKELEDIKARAGTADKARERAEKAEKRAENLERQLSVEKGQRETEASVRNELSEAKSALEKARKVAADTAKKHEEELKAARQETSKARTARSGSLSNLVIKSRSAEENATRLQKELDVMRKAVEDDKAAVAQAKTTTAEQLQELQDTIAKLRNEGEDGGKVLQELHDEIKTLRDSSSSQAAKQESDLKEMTSMTEKLQTELKQYEDLSQQLRKENKDLSAASNESAKEQKRHEEEFKEQLAGVEEESQNKIKALQQTITRLEKESADTEAKHREALQERSRSLDDSAADRDALQAEIASLQSQLEEAGKHGEDAQRLQDAHGDLQQELAAKDRDAKSLAAEKDEFVSRVQELETAAEAARVEGVRALEGKDAELATLRGSLSEAAAATDRLEKAKAELESTAAELRREVDESRKHEADTAAQLDKVEEEHERALQVKEAELASLRSSLDESRKHGDSRLNEAKEEHERALQAQETELASLRSSLDDHKATTTAQLQAVGKEKGELEQTTARLKQQLEHLQSSLESSAADLRSSHHQALAAKDTELATLKHSMQAQLDGLAERHAAHVERSVNQALSARDAEIESLRTSAHDLTARSTAAEEAKAEAERNLAEFAQREAALRAELGALSSAREAERLTSLAPLEGDNAALRSQVASLREQIDLVLASQSASQSSSSPRGGQAQAHEAALREALEKANEAAAVTAEEARVEHEAAIAGLKLAHEEAVQEARKAVEEAFGERAKEEVEKEVEKARSQRGAEVSELKRRLETAEREASEAREILEVEREASALRRQREEEEEEQQQQQDKVALRVTELEHALAGAERRARGVESPVWVERPSDGGIDMDNVHEQLEEKDGIVKDLSGRVAELEIELSGVRAELERWKTGGHGALGEIAGNSVVARQWTPSKSHSVKGMEDPFVTGGLAARQGLDIENGYEVDEHGGTIEGTLASIQEQVRQLEELNEQIGVESARWQGNMDSARPSPSPVRGLP